MSKKKDADRRYDKKGRLLRTGEMQMSDGRYRYKHPPVVKGGKEIVLYSWRLEMHDRYPKGKRKDLSLREKERALMMDLFNEITPEGGHYTVLDLVETYTSLKQGVRPSTRAGYKTVINLLKKDPFGARRIDKVKLVDAKIWLVNLQKNGKGYSSIHTIRGVLRPAFQMAVDDDMIRKNPFGFELASVIVNDSVTREAMTPGQERMFLSFVKNDPHFCRYYDGIFILLNTGLRISEFVGLTKKDIDFKEMTIRIDHQLIRYNEIGYKIMPPKTEKGNRLVPMSDEVAAAFRRIIKDRQKVKKEVIVDGYSGFIFLDKDQNPMVANHWEKYFQHIREKHNSIYVEKLPRITPHVCRHTFCSRMAHAGMNPKTLQYIMGHSDISVTLNVYTHTHFEDVKEELQRLSQKTSV